MTKSIPTKQSADRSEFLYHASHLLFATCPGLSRFYMSEFQQTLRQQETKASKVIARQMCSRCGQIFVPGLNARVVLKTTRRYRHGINKSNRHRNQLVYQCNACLHKKRLQGSERDIPKAPFVSDVVHAPTPSAPPVAAVTKQPPQQPPVATGKKKKNKKNNLQALIANRKQNETKSSSAFGLDDFLSSL
ncbi:Rpr2-domain-containing protein [Lichtheimia hyalospora FSU 10163]|nr:Rpr2-domain-containing protein [Lichtheimia hyalospora FSU 10163]